MKIGIDIDDTLVNTREQQIIYWKQYYNNNPKVGYTEELPPQINDFDDLYVQDFWDEYRIPLSFETTFKENLSVILHKLVEEGHDLQIITSRPDEKYGDLKGKLSNWFKEHDIPIFRYNTNIREKAKFAKVNSFDLIIDDSIRECNKAKELGLKAILFNHNDTYDGFQTTDWNKVYEYIKKAI